MSNEVPLLAARDLVKGHGRTEALRGASAELRAGEILAVTGASGSGKSTLLHCLAGIVRPDTGSVTWRQYGAAQEIWSTAYPTNNAHASAPTASPGREVSLESRTWTA